MNISNLIMAFGITWVACGGLAAFSYESSIPNEDWTLRDARIACSLVVLGPVGIAKHWPKVRAFLRRSA